MGAATFHASVLRPPPGHDQYTLYTNPSSFRSTACGRFVRLFEASPGAANKRCRARGTLRKGYVSVYSGRHVLAAATACQRAAGIAVRQVRVPPETLCMVTEGACPVTRESAANAARIESLQRFEENGYVIGTSRSCKNRTFFVAAA